MHQSNCAKCSKVRLNYHLRNGNSVSHDEYDLLILRFPQPHFPALTRHPLEVMFSSHSYLASSANNRFGSGAVCVFVLDRLA